MNELTACGVCMFAEVKVKRRRLQCCYGDPSDEVVTLGEGEGGGGRDREGRRREGHVF